MPAKENLITFYCEDKKVVGSVNGLVCLYGTYLNSKSITCMGIWNPATNKYKDIPPPSTERNGRATKFYVGFGFDPVAHDYKVIYFANIENQPFVADVYSCNAGSWNNNRVTSTWISRGGRFSRPLIVNNRVYWIDHDKLDGQHLVISFDITHEIFRLLPDLDRFYRCPQRHHIVNLRDSLAAIIYDADITFTMDVYIFDETVLSSFGGGGWSKKYTVGPITLTRDMRFLQCFWSGDLLFKDFEQFKLVCIDPETHSNETLSSGLYRYDISWVFLTFTYSYVYKETLVSVKGMKQIQADPSDIFFIER